MNKQSPKDHIECRHTEKQIVKMYVTCLAGKKKSFPFEDLPTEYQKQAGRMITQAEFDKTEVNAAVQYVAERWAQFNR